MSGSKLEETFRFDRSENDERTSATPSRVSIPGNPPEDPIVVEKRRVAVATLTEAIVSLASNAGGEYETPAAKSKKLWKILCEQARSAGSEEEFRKRWALLDRNKVFGPLFKYLNPGREFICHLHRYTLISCNAGELFIGPRAPLVGVKHELDGKNTDMLFYDLLMSLDQI